MKIFTLLSLLTISTQLFSQQTTWKWGNRIGSSKVVGASGTEEKPIDISTDNFGNVYVLNQVYPNGLLSVDTVLFSTYQTNAQNILLTSFRCDGTYRWTKIIGAPAGSYCNSVQTDTLGGVYLFCNLYIHNGTTGHIDNDSTISGTEQSMHLIKYDTTGVLQWIRSPQSDTISYSNALYNSKSIDMHVSKAGKISLLTILPAGAHVNSNLILNESGTYILEYDRFGNYLSAPELNFQIRGLGNSYQLSTKMTRSQNENIIISGYKYNQNLDTLILENDTIDAIAFVASYNNSGTLLWHHEILKYDPLYSNGLFLGRPVTDEFNSVYLSGSASHLDTIAGHVVNNSLSPNITATPILVKLFANGTLAWAKNADAATAALASGLAYSDSTIAVSGFYAGKLVWQGTNQSIGPSNQGYNPFIAIFNAQTGAFLQQDTLTSTNGYDERSVALTVDKNGSFYLCGTFESNISLPNGTFQAWGDGDIFFAKYGTDACEFSISIDELSQKHKFSFIIYPNPGNGEFSMQFINDIRNSTLKIIDLSGKLVWQDLAFSAETGIVKKIKLKLASGIYFVQIQNGDFIATRKLLIH